MSFPSRAAGISLRVGVWGAEEEPTGRTRDRHLNSKSGALGFFFFAILIEDSGDCSDCVEIMGGSLEVGVLETCGI